MNRIRKFFCTLLIILLFTGTSFSETGLVLSGGGGKGAYEVGVWKALTEYGIAQEVSIISGTSVGGLNSALFALLDVEEIEYLWKNVVPSYLTVDEEDNEVFISQYGVGKLIDTLPLARLNDGVPVVVINTVRNKNKLLKMTSSFLGLVKPGDNTYRFRLDIEEIPEMKQKLLATSAFPVLTDPVLLSDGYTYVDGGWEAIGGDNTPLDGIFQVGYKPITQMKDIYVVYLSDQPERRVKITDYDEYNIIEIIPSTSLSDILDGTCNFTASRISLLIELGYKDTVKLLKDQGKYPVSSFWYQ